MTSRPVPPRHSPPTWREILSAWDPHSAHRPASVHAAQLLAAKGEWPAAIAAYNELLEHQPENRAAWASLAALHRQRGDHAAAAACLERSHANESAATTAFFMAAEGYADTPAAMPGDYVEALFDRYAERFDEHLAQLGYRAPAVLFETVRAHRGEGAERLSAVLDLGCGTGLAGACFRSASTWIEGVDLSGAMIERARSKKIYDHLEQADLVDFLERGGARSQYDLIVAADVLNYLGDLSPALTGCARRLGSGGLLAFTLEAWPAEDVSDAVAASTPGYHLRGNRRYAHERRSLSRSLAAAGLQQVSIEADVLRYEQGVAVESYVCLCAVHERDEPERSSPETD